MNFNKDNVPDFFTKEIIDGLQRLLFLNLSNPPARDTIKATALVWAEVLYLKLKLEDTELNRKILKRTFSELGASVEKFPTPVLFLKEFENIKFKYQYKRPLDSKKILTTEEWNARYEKNKKYIEIAKKVINGETYEA